jgi:uncharacterized membrane protein
MDIKGKLEKLKNSENLWVVAYLSILTYVISVAMFTFIFLSAPLFLQSGNFLLRGFAAVAYKMVETFVMCHQLPERSLFILNVQFPICARDVGIYIGSSLGGILGLLPGLKIPRIMRGKLMLLVMTVPMAVDGITQTLLFERESSNALRVATGFFFGFGLLYYLTWHISERYRSINVNKSDILKLAVGVNAVLFIIILAFGLYVGTFFTSKQNAVESALGSAFGSAQAIARANGYRVYYIPPNSLNNVRIDPYFGSYDDAVLRDLARMRYSDHPYGMWLVAAVSTNKTPEGKVVYFSDTGGFVAYVDAQSGEVVLKRGAISSPPAGERFSVIVLPDTQFYSESYPDIFKNQTSWIAGNAIGMKIAFVIHEGDLVDVYDSAAQWQVANESMSALDGVVPYSVLPGNHDRPTTFFNRYFPPSRYSGFAWYGGNYSGNDNSFQLFTAGGSDYIIVNLGFCPGDMAVQWANETLRANAGRKAIVVTHGYINENAQRTVIGCSDTNYLWDGLIAPNPNVFLVLSGHVHAETRRSDAANGRIVHQLMADFQEGENGGNGYLRILEFSPQERKLYVKTYSPYLNQYKEDESSQFTLDL